LSGAPPSTHLRTRFGGLSGHDSSLKHVLTTHNPNTVIVDLDEAPDGDIGPVVPPPSAPVTKRRSVKLPQSP